SSFEDVGCAHYAFDEIEQLVAQRIVEACNTEGSRFCPRDVISLGNAVLWATRYYIVTSIAAFQSETQLKSGFLRTARYATDTASVLVEPISLNQAITRDFAAVLTLLAIEGPVYAPPTATSSPFTDVDIGDPYVYGDGDYGADWIVELYSRGIVAGCSTGVNAVYCRKEVVTRSGFAKMLGK
ncbi:MAG: hypothetical protein GY701_11970, partial [Sulfitobacter sp.]|nr:hypothetical protein [Sulfitobacter sp.]